MKRHKKFMTAVIVAVMAGVLTKGALLAWPEIGPSSAMTKRDNPDSCAVEDSDVRLEIEDRLFEEGWLVARSDSNTILSYSIIPGQTAPALSGISWQEISKPLQLTDTLRPKRNCVILIRADKNGSAIHKNLTFSYCGFVERLLCSSDSDKDPILRQLMCSYSDEQPIIISYDYLIEDSIMSREDIANFDILQERLSIEENHCHVDSIRSYTVANPNDEVLEKDYPPIGYINLKSTHAEQ